MDMKGNQINLINLKPLYEEFMGLKLSKNNANKAIELASKFVDVRYFYKSCTRDERKEVFIKLEEAFNMIGDRANADKYADKIKKINEINEQNEMVSLFQNFMKLELLENNTVNVDEVTELASKFVENQCFIEKCPEKNKNDVYAKLAKAYYLKDDYKNAYKYLCKNTGIFYIEDENQIAVFDDKFDYYRKNYQQRYEFTEICYDVYRKLGYLSEEAYEQYVTSNYQYISGISEKLSKEKEVYFQKVMEETDPHEMTEEKLRLLLGRFEVMNLFKYNKDDAEKVIEFASIFVENQYFLEKCPEKNKNDVYAKLAKAYYLKDDYKNAYKYLCKNTGIVYIEDEDQNRIEILNSACNYYQEKELMEICYDVYHKLGKLSEAEYRQYTSPEREVHFQKVLKETDPDIMTKEELGLLLGRFETLDLSKNNKKDAKEAIELASKFMNAPIFNEVYNTQLSKRRIYGQLGEAYYIIGEYCSALINLGNTGIITKKVDCLRDIELEDIYKKSSDKLSTIYKEIDKCTNEIGKALVEDPLNFDIQ